MSHSISEPSILLLHDGELADVAALLCELGAATTERRGAPAREDAEQSWRLLLASARRALELPTSLLRSSTLRIAILDGESRTVCSLLRRASFEMIVRRPVHPVALRLLLLHALYRGPEKRRTPRVSVGAPVTLRAGLRRHRAILAEISERGCRLLTSQRVTLGQTLALQIPAELAGGRAFSLKGMVVRATPAEIGAPGVLTLEFDPLRGRLRERLRGVVSAHSGGPSALTRIESISEAPRPAAVLPLPQSIDAPGPPLPGPVAIPQIVDTGPVAAEPIEAPAEVTQSELESELALESESELESETELARLALPRRLVPLCDEASRVILARSLSRDGLRADPSPRLARSAVLRLALHVEAGGPAILVTAHVEPGASREPGESGAPGEMDPGLWLRFKDLAPSDGERLDALLAGLSIFAGGDGPEHALVVCEILDPPHG